MTAGESEPAHYETEQLRDQLSEIDRQMVAIAEQFTEIQGAIAERTLLVGDLTRQLDTRTAERITPRLQAYADTANRLASAQAEQQQLEIVLRQWDRARDLEMVAIRLRTEREQLQSTLAATQSALDARREEVLSQLNEEFQEAVAAVGIPGVRTASIHPTTYLPLLNGDPFANISAAGGIITATQVAYWVSLLTVALRLGNTDYPAFLIIDSPRLALNTAEALSAALYRRLATKARAYGDRLQIIIADNELPQDYRRDFEEVEFTYTRPTVSTITHPGPAKVTPIDRLAG